VTQLARRDRRTLAARMLAALEQGIREGTRMALAGGVAGDDGEPERKRVALLLFKASKAINADTVSKRPILSGEQRRRAVDLAGEAERLARLLARTFTEYADKAIAGVARSGLVHVDDVAALGGLSGRLMSTKDEDEP
jgi:hypothetical protein